MIFISVVVGGSGKLDGMIQHSMCGLIAGVIFTVVMSGIDLLLAIIEDYGDVFIPFPIPVDLHCYVNLHAV